MLTTDISVLPLSFSIFLKKGFHAQSKYTHKDIISVPKEFILQPGKRDKPTCDHPYCPKTSPNISSDMEQIADLHQSVGYFKYADIAFSNNKILPCRKKKV